MLETRHDNPWCQDADIYLLACQRKINEEAWGSPPLAAMSGFLRPAFDTMVEFVADPGEIVIGMPIATPAGRKVVGLACIFDSYPNRTFADGWARRLTSDLVPLLMSRVLAPRKLVEMALPCDFSLRAAYDALVEANMDFATFGTILLTCPPHK